MRHSVEIGDGLRLDAYMLATSVTACIGIRGSGKTNGAGVIAEGVLTAGIQVVVLDQVGPWFALRLAADGKLPSPFQIPVLGGAHGDIALHPQSGRAVAEALARTGSSAVLDVSRMGKGERIRFAADFAEAFFEAMKLHPHPVLLVVEESQRFIPQMMRYADPALSRCLGAFEEMAEVGRNFGIGMVLISQRPQKINKDVLFLSDTLLVFRTLGVPERKTIAEWVREKGIAGREDVADEIPGLKAGTAVVWSPAVFEVYGRYMLRLKATYDASATPGGARAAVKTSPLDLAALEKTMADVVAEARANDPSVLRAEVARLNMQLDAARGAQSPATARLPVEVEDRLADARRSVSQLEADGRSIATTAAEISATLDGITASVARYRREHERVRIDGAGVPTGAGSAPPRRPTDPEPAPARAGAVDRDADVKSGAMRMLRALAATAKDGLTKRELGALSGVKPSGGTFDTYLSRMRNAGYIENGGAGYRITAAGRVLVGDVPLLSGRALMEWWLPRLGEKPALMLRLLYDADGPVSKEYLATSVGLASSGGTFDTYVSRLKARGLVDRVSGGYRCAEILRSG